MKTEVINAGIGGHNIADIRARLDSDVFAHNPEVVVLIVGTNDSINSKNLTPSDEFERVYRKVCKEIAGRSRLVVATILPFHLPYLWTRHNVEDYAGISPAERHADVNRIVRQTADELSLPLADLFGVFSEIGNIGESPESLLRNPLNSGAPDGVHPTPQGYALIAAAVYQTLLTAGLAGAERIVCLGDSITYGASAKGEGTATGETYPACLYRLLSRGDDYA